MSGDVLKIIKSTYGVDDRRDGSGGVSHAQAKGGISQGGQSQGQSASTPHFGIKGREPLTQDLFEYKGQKLTKEETKRKTYDDVYKHEAAHLSKAGKYASTGICIDFDGNGFATSGHVGIKMPTLNPDNIEETINHATAVIASAEAPASFDELSDADRNVAAQARSVKAQALAMRGNQSKNNAQRKPLNIIA